MAFVEMKTWGSCEDFLEGNEADGYFSREGEAGVNQSRCGGETRLERDAD